MDRCGVLFKSEGGYEGTLSVRLPVRLLFHPRFHVVPAVAVGVFRFSRLFGGRPIERAEGEGTEGRKGFCL